MQPVLDVELGSFSFFSRHQSYELECYICSDILIQFTAITWLKEFVDLSGPMMLSFVSGILSAILPCLAYDDETRISILAISACVYISSLYHPVQGHQFVSKLARVQDHGFLEEFLELHNLSPPSPISSPTLPSCHPLPPLPFCTFSLFTLSLPPLFPLSPFLPYTTHSFLPLSSPPSWGSPLIQLGHPGLL